MSKAINVQVGTFQTIWEFDIVTQKLVPQMDMVNTRYALELFRLSENGTEKELISEQETRNSRFSFYNSPDEILIEPLNNYQITLKTKSISMRSTVICDPEFSTPDVPRMSEVSISEEQSSSEEGRSGFVSIDWEPLVVEKFDVEVYELSDSQNLLIKDLPDEMVKGRVKDYIEKKELSKNHNTLFSNIC
jgi:hypothetical protein